MRVPIRISPVSKYRAKRTDGYASQAEARRGAELELMEREGLIVGLGKQIRFILIPKSKHGKEVVYVADFVYMDVETQKVAREDVKGFRTPLYKLKKRMMAELGWEITEVK
jgi:hypothetical protein